MAFSVEHRILKDASPKESLTGAVLTATYCVRFDNVSMDWAANEEPALPGFMELFKKYGPNNIKAAIPPNAFVGHIRAFTDDCYLADIGCPKSAWYVGYRVIAPLDVDAPPTFHVMFSGGSLDCGLASMKEHLGVAFVDGVRTYTWDGVWLKRGGVWNDALGYFLPGPKAPWVVPEVDI
jgi:hypothetical protein